MHDGDPGSERWLFYWNCFTGIVLWLSVFRALSWGGIDSYVACLSEVCDCGISLSYSLTIYVAGHFQVIAFRTESSPIY